MSASSSDEYASLGGAQARLPGGSQVQSSCAGMSSMDADAYQDVCMAWSSHFFYGKGFGADDCIGDVRLGRWGTGSNSMHYTSCNYRKNYFYLFISLLMCSLKSQLQN